MTNPLPEYQPVILCGGSGSRLWPLSRELLPKQFIRLTNDRSLLQNTLRRLQHAPSARPAILVCNETHRFIAAEQVLQAGGGPVEFLLEPSPRNTAPAITAAALRAMRDGADPILLVMPSDHVMEDDENLAVAFAAALTAADEGALVTFGIVPTAPLTGYGYIQAHGADQSATDGVQPNALKVQKFVEKPDAARAAEFLASGDYYWNSGIFAFKASTFLAEMARHAPEILNQVRAAVAVGTGSDDAFSLAPEPFAACPNDSIDYAVMEHTASAVVIPLTTTWSDVGAWDAVWDIAAKSTDGNSVSGDVVLKDSHNCLVHSTHRLVATIGLENIVVIETADAVLVVHKDRTQDVKPMVELFKTQRRHEMTHHREVQRPWGSYDSVGTGPRYQIKRIMVKPGAKLSSQMHHHRAEHWIVVSGTARIRNGDKTYLLTENQSTYIPLGEVHSLENPGKIPLELIEVQSGAYLGEDDIVRFDDIYGRV